MVLLSTVRREGWKVLFFLENVVRNKCTYKVHQQLMNNLLSTLVSKFPHMLVIRCMSQLPNIKISIAFVIDCPPHAYAEIVSCWQQKAVHKLLTHLVEVGEAR